MATVARNATVPAPRVGQQDLPSPFAVAARKSASAVANVSELPGRLREDVCTVDSFEAVLQGVSSGSSREISAARKALTHFTNEQGSTSIAALNAALNLCIMLGAADEIEEAELLARRTLGRCETDV